MEGSIIQSYHHINHWISSQNSIFQSFFCSYRNRFDILLWNNTTFNFIKEFEAFSFFFLRFNLEPAMTVLSATSRLFDIFSFSLRFSFDCFAICNLRLTNICFDAEFPFHTINNNIKMKFAHSGDDCLS